MWTGRIRLRFCFYTNLLCPILLSIPPLLFMLTIARFCDPPQRFALWFHVPGTFSGI